MFDDLRAADRSLRFAPTFSAFEVEPNDPRIFAAAVITLAAAGLGASGIPARRAASVR